MFSLPVCCMYREMRHINFVYSFFDSLYCIKIVISFYLTLLSLSFCPFFLARRLYIFFNHEGKLKDENKAERVKETKLNSYFLPRKRNKSGSLLWKCACPISLQKSKHCQCRILYLCFLFLYLLLPGHH